MFPACVVAPASTYRTAERAVRLHQLRTDQPDLFALIAPLGASKAYLLMTLAPATVRALLGKRHPVPGSRARKTLEQMTLGELMEVLAAGSQSSPDVATSLYRTYRRQVHALIRTLDDLIEQGPAAPALSEAELDELHDELQQATDRFARAFRLGDD